MWVAVECIFHKGVLTLSLGGVSGIELEFNTCQLLSWKYSSNILLRFFPAICALKERLSKGQHHVRCKWNRSLERSSFLGPLLCPLSALVFRPDAVWWRLTTSSGAFWVSCFLPYRKNLKGYTMGVPSATREKFAFSKQEVLKLKQCSSIFLSAFERGPATWSKVAVLVSFLAWFPQINNSHTGSWFALYVLYQTTTNQNSKRSFF